jgi:adenosylmethionine-8-amino-7-oxononanoate aminotransferase
MSGVEAVRIKGTILACNMVTDEAGGYLNRAAQHARDFFIDRGMLLRPLGDVLYCMPPYCVSDEELAMVYDGVSEFVATAR